MSGLVHTFVGCAYSRNNCLRRTRGKTFFPVEGGDFVLGTRFCTGKRIKMQNRSSDYRLTVYCVDWQTAFAK